MRDVAVGEQDHYYLPLTHRLSRCDKGYFVTGGQCLRRCVKGLLKDLYKVTGSCSLSPHA